jgi:amino acid adenylation domain-containing protein
VLLTQQALRERLPAGAARVVCLDAEWEQIHRQPDADLTARATADNLVYVIYTSGSTGQPKGCMVTHANVARLFTATDAWYGFNERDVWTLFHSYDFDFSVWEIWGALLHGGRLVVVPYWLSRSPEQFYRLLQAEGVTVLNQTPSAFRQLIRAEEALGIAPDLALRYIIFGGEALDFQSLRPWFERHGDQRPRLVNMYGITETTVHVTYRPVSRADLESATGSAIGVPIPDLSLYVLDQNRQPVPIGVPGELYVSGAGVARGYLNRPELTAERFLDWTVDGGGRTLEPPTIPGTAPAVRLYKTGDQVRLLAGGDIEYLGRIDQQVKIRGFRVELGEIEAALVAQPGAAQAAVMAREDGPGGRSLVAYVVPATDARVDAAELRAALGRMLPEYMVPAAFVALEAVPLTPNGKLDRRALPAPDGHLELDGQYVPPRNPVEDQLCAIWQEVLRRDRVGVHDNFFRLGGHSLSAILAMAGVCARFDVHLSVAAFFQNPTVEKLAEVVGKRSTVDLWKPVVSIQCQGGEPPVFFVPGAGGSVAYLRDLAYHLGRGRPFYGLQPPGLDGQSTPLARIEELAAHFVEAIQAVQPQGPYYLAGHSFGGQVAFEMAQQLQRKGHVVDLLAVVDTTAPLPQPHRATELETWDDATAIMELARLVERLYNQRLDLSYEKLASSTAAGQLEQLLASLKQVGLQPPTADTSQIRGLMQVYKANAHAVVTYECPPDQAVPTRIVLFRAGDGSPQDGDGQDLCGRCLGWSKYSDGPVEVHEIPGDHLSMMVEPHVQHLAERLIPILSNVHSSQFEMTSITRRTIDE